MGSEDGARPKRRPRRCCCSCLGCMGAIALLVCMAIGALTFGRPYLRNFGVFGPPAREVYSGAVDLVASQAVNQVFQNAGLQGAQAVVIPMKGIDGQLAYIALDENSGFVGSSSQVGTEQLFAQVLQGLSQANRDGELNIRRVTLDYRDTSGNSLISITAPQLAIDGLVAGILTQEQFLAQVDVDFSKLISYQELMRLMQETQP